MKTTKYVRIEYDEATQIKLREWAIAQGFDLTIKWSGSKQPVEAFNFHTTIFWTTSLHDYIDETIGYTWPQSAKAVGFELLDNETVAVLKVEGDNLISTRDVMVMYGMKDDWPSFLPHVSVSYAKDHPTDVTLPNFPLVYDKLIISDAK